MPEGIEKRVRLGYQAGGGGISQLKIQLMGGWCGCGWLVWLWLVPIISQSTFPINLARDYHSTSEFARDRARRSLS